MVGSGDDTAAGARTAGSDNAPAAGPDLNGSIAADRHHRPQTRVVNRTRFQDIRKTAPCAAPRRPSTAVLVPTRTRASSTYSNESRNNGLFDTEETTRPQRIPERTGQATAIPKVRHAQRADEARNRVSNPRAANRIHRQLSPAGLPANGQRLARFRGHEGVLTMAFRKHASTQDNRGKERRPMPLCAVASVRAVPAAS